jgi:hypothetical protein
VANDDARKNLHSVYFSDGVWESMQTFARFFTLTTGITNNRGQQMGAGTFIDIACKAYIKQNSAVLDIAKRFFEKASEEDVHGLFDGIREELRNNDREV